MGDHSQVLKVSEDMYRTNIPEVGDHFQVPKVSEVLRTYLLYLLYGGNAYGCILVHTGAYGGPGTLISGPNLFSDPALFLGPTALSGHTGFYHEETNSQGNLIAI